MMTDERDSGWLAPTWFVDCDAPAVQQFAHEAADGATDPIDTARNLFYAIRDGFRYDPYQTDYAPEAFRASTVVSDRCQLV